MEIIIVIVWLACITAGGIIDGERGILLGALLGVIGVLVSHLLCEQDKRHKQTLEALGVTKTSDVKKPMTTQKFKATRQSAHRYV